MAYINRLNNGCGGRDAFYIPKGTTPLIWPEESRFGDENLSEEQKSRGIRLRYYPETYVIRRDEQDGKLHLKNISEQNCPSPTKLAEYSNKINPNVIVYGYMLCLDDKLKDTLSPEDRECLQEIKAQFQKLANEDITASVAHELKHDFNDGKLKEIQQKHGRRLTRDQFIASCFLDEQTASTAEIFSQTTPKNIAEMRNIFEKRKEQWMANPRNQRYYKEYGDFDVRWNDYQKENAHLPEASDDKMFQDVVSAYMTFVVDGKEHDISSVPPSNDAQHISASTLRRQKAR